MTASTSSRVIRFLFRALSVLAVVPPAITAPSSASYSHYQYDLTVPQFTPDGRLLQVEYATAAADRSGPVLWVRLSDNRGAILLAPRRSQLSRLVLWPGSHGGAVVVALSGVVSDGLALLREAEEAGRNYRRRHGCVPTAARVAAFAADACQQRAFGGGIRPYGSSFLACGLLPSPSEKGGGSSFVVEAWLADPSGSLQAVPSVRVVGGGDALRAAILRRLEGERVSEEATLGTALRIAARILSEEWHRVSSLDRPLGTLEAVLLSPDMGVHKLTPQQVRDLLCTEEETEAER